MKLKRYFLAATAPGCVRWAALCLLVVLAGAVPERPARSGEGSPTPEKNGKSRDPQAVTEPAAPSSRPPLINLQGRSIEDRTPWRSQRENDGEFKAWCDAIITAHYTATEEFAKRARRDLTFAHLFNQPEVYRGQVVHFEGRLKRLRRFPTPTFIWSQGVRDFYEGWLFKPELYGPDYPLCVDITDLSSGLKVSESLDQEVTVEGFFFKLYAYKTARGKGKVCPLLVAHALVLKPAAASPADEGAFGSLFATSGGFIAAFCALVLVTTSLIVGLNWWYRKGDRVVRSRLEGIRDNDFVEPTFDSADPAAAPPGEGNTVNGQTDSFL